MKITLSSRCIRIFLSIGTSFLLIQATLFGSGADKPKKQYNPENYTHLLDRKPAADWFLDAKIGTYFHWGPYSVAGGGCWYGRRMYDKDSKEDWKKVTYDFHQDHWGEDVHYHDFIELWKAPRFNAKEWVDIFEASGAKMIGTMGEHHDGFSLWDSKVNPWNSVQKGPGIDIVKSIYDEVKKRDLKFMVSFHHGANMLFFPKSKLPAELNRMKREALNNEFPFRVVQENIVPQDEKYKQVYSTMSYDEVCDLWYDKLNEVINQYCPDHIWMDYGQRYIKESHRVKFVDRYFKKADELGKDVVLNCKGHFFPRNIAVDNYERSSVPDILEQPWMADFSLGPGWSHMTGRNQQGKKVSDMIKHVADVVSKNGLILFNVPPTPDGRIREVDRKALIGMGDWLKIYGDAIYGTRPFVKFGEGLTELIADADDEWNEYGNYKVSLDKLNANDVRYTRKGKTVFAIQLGWDNEQQSRVLTTFSPKNEELKVSSVSVLGSDQKVEWKMTPQGLHITRPTNKPEQAELGFAYRIELE